MAVSISEPYVPPSGGATITRVAEAIAQPKGETRSDGPAPSTLERVSRSRRRRAERAATSTDDALFDDISTEGGSMNSIKTRFPAALFALVIATMAAAGASVASAAGAQIDREPMRWHGQSGNAHMSLVGDGATAQLVRTENGISYSIRTEGLQAGHAYTLWVVVINNPAACTVSPCSPPVDIIGNPATNSQVIYGGGHVVGGDGQAGFGGRVSTGPLPDGWFANRGLDNPLGAGVHLVLNDHGPVLTEFMPEMIQTYRAGCTDASLPGFFPASAKADGTPGPNTCRLWQMAIFEP